MDINKKNIIIYEPHYRSRESFLPTWVNMWRSVIRSRYLVYQLFKKDFFFMYKRSFLSFGWFFISPLLGIISWVFMNAANILEPGDIGMPYPAYILLSTSIWSLFMGFYQSASDTLYAGLPFILDIKCPHEILLVKQTAQHLAGFLLGFIITLIVLLMFNIRPSWGIVFFPLVVAPLFFLGAGIGLLAAIFRVMMPDLKRCLDFMMQLLMFITPVVYSENIKTPLLKNTIKYNPLTYLLSGARDTVIRGSLTHFEGFVWASLFSFLVFLLASRIMYQSEDKVIERMF
ncbi:MAG: ABC transporter permease [Desulfobacterales bacterium]|nr:ABC transporter permease [Desulfobacterales bacterium]